MCGGACINSEILDQNLSENAKIMGEYFMKRMKELPHVKEVRGRGLLTGCEFDIPIAHEVKAECMKRRLLITAIGESTNRMIPPLILKKEHVDQAIDIMKKPSMRQCFPISPRISGLHNKSRNQKEGYVK